MKYSDLTDSQQFDIEYRSYFKLVWDILTLDFIGVLLSILLFWIVYSINLGFTVFTYQEGKHLLLAISVLLYPFIAFMGYQMVKNDIDDIVKDVKILVLKIKMRKVKKEERKVIKKNDIIVNIFKEKNNG